MTTPFVAAFEAWAEAMQRAGKISDPAAFAVYEDMWGAFAHHCSEAVPPLTLHQLTMADLSRFIQSRGSRGEGGTSPRYVWRLLSLIDRVLAHEALQADRPAPTIARDLLASRPEWLYANTRREELIDYLTPSQAHDLQSHLSKMLMGGNDAGFIDAPWQQVRNGAAITLQLGAGLTPGEVRALTLSDVVSQGRGSAAIPWKIRVKGESRATSRETPIAPWAGQLLARWLQVRSRLAIPLEWLFPSTKTGKPWSKPAQYVALQEVLASAGWSADEIKGGAFRLRHTFALRQLEKGFSEVEVAKWLGIAPEAMSRYRGVLLDPVLEVA